MAENPASWGEAEKVIDKAIDDWDHEELEDVCGASLPKRIADALREAGLLTCRHGIPTSDEHAKNCAFYEDPGHLKPAGPARKIRGSWTNNEDTDRAGAQRRAGP